MIKDRILDQIIRELYDRPIITNNVRPHYVERLIMAGLGDDWRVVSADWSGWDLENGKGNRIEVKQSAARQTWSERASIGQKPTTGRFDIRQRKGYFTDGGRRFVQFEKPARAADVFIFAWHPIFDPRIADHRNAAQWEFYVVPSEELPITGATIGLASIQSKWPPVRFDDLAKTVYNTFQHLPARAKSGE